MNLGKLYLVPITITNNSLSSSIPQYVIDITKELRYFISERAKTTRAYLKEVESNHTLQDITVYELNKHKAQEGIEEFLQDAFQGNDIGLMSEAGCPAVADPGSLVVEAAHQMGIEVIPLVGPSSILLSLMGSGFNGQSFKFNGYIPLKDKGEFNSILKKMEAEANKGCTQIFIETPYRNQSTFEVLLKKLHPNTSISIAVDLLGKEQSIQTYTVGEWKKAGFKIPKIPAIFLIGKQSDQKRFFDINY
jgi:16S rRNA (cytidine1402-2'-O)-methyltransferase